MNKRDRKWNMQYEKLVELQRTTGHCVVPRSYEQARSLRTWVSTQRKTNNDNTIRLDRKERLEEIGFAWEDVCGFKPDDKKWNKQHETLLKFKGISGHCMVPQSYEQDKSLGIWASTQRTFHGKLTATSSGTSSMKRLLSLKERLAIVWCQGPTSKTSLWGFGLARSGAIITMTTFDLIERDSWTKSGSLGKLKVPTRTTTTSKRYGTRTMKSWSNLNE
jgi:hypothetical protein